MINLFLMKSILTRKIKPEIHQRSLTNKLL